MFKTYSDRTPMQRALAALLIVLETLMPVLYAAKATAQVNPAVINPDRSVTGQRPVVSVAANGVPIVQISPPSAAGVSNNRFTDYNVGGKGVILNNSGANNQTQLGGWIAGNPMLGNSSAKTILNQVTGATPSSLAGFTEVAGNQANVIVANPNGITCDGCGFINAPRATLTTGTPQLGADGSVLGFRVQQGQINIEGQGLAARNVDQVDLISRSLRVNAEIWAGRLNAVTGTGQVDYESGQASGQATSQGATDAAPGVSLDVSQLGGMYADSIRLIGTENGVGVNSAGSIAALTGTLDINQAGDVRIVGGNVQAAGDLAIRSGQDISNTGVVYTPGKAELQARGALQNTGVLSSGKDLKGMVGSLHNTGSIAAGADKSGKIASPGDVSITAIDSLQNGGQILAGNNLTLVGGSVVLDNGKLVANNQAAVTAGAALDHRGGQIHASDIAISSAGKFDNTNGVVESRNLLTFNGDRDVDNTQGKLLAGDSVNITTAGQLVNAGGTVAGNQGVAVSAGGGVANAAGSIQANSVQLNAPAVNNAGGRIVQTGSADQSMQLAGTFDNTGGTFATNAANISLGAASVINTQGEISHGGSGRLEIAATGNLDNTRGAVSTNGGLALIASNLINTEGKTTSIGNTQVAANSITNANGTLAAANDLNLNASGLLDNQGGKIQADKDMTVAAGSITNTTGVIYAAHNMTTSVAADVDNKHGVLQADGLLTSRIGGGLDNQQGVVQGGSLDLQAGSIANGSGNIQQTGASTATIKVAGALDNAYGSIQANGSDLGVSAGSISNVGGLIGHSGNGTLSIQSGGAIDNTGGKMLASGRLQLDAESLNNGQQGLVQSASSATLTTAGDIANNSGTLSSGAALTVKAGGNINNAGGNVEAGGAAAISATNIDNGNGRIASLGTSDVSLDAVGTLNNSNGLIGANGSATIGAGNFNNANGTVTTQQDLSIKAGKFVNKNGVLNVGGAMALQIDDAFDNSGNTLSARNGLTIRAKSIDNSVNSDGVAGRMVVSGNGSLKLEAVGGINNTGGFLGSNGDVALKGDSINNNGGTAYSRQSLAITTAAHVDNTLGTLQADADLTARIGGVLGNQQGLMQASRMDVQAGSLDNSKGSVLQLGAGDNIVSVTGALNNAQGEIVSNGSTLSIAGGSIGNSAGVISHAGDGRLAIASSGAINNDSGRIVTASELKIDTQSISNNVQGGKAGLIQSGTAAAITAGGEVNNAGGSIVSGAALAVQAKGDIKNGGGILQAANALTLQGANVDNSTGRAVSLDTSGVTVGAANLLNNNTGYIGGNGNVAISADSANNVAGIVYARQALSIASAGQVDNSQGTLQADADLTANVGGTLGNRQGLIQASRMDLQGGSLDNGTGQVLQLGSGDGSISMQDALSNAQGIISSAAGNLNVAAGSIDNRGGSINGGGAMALLAQGDIDNRGGSIQAAKALALQAANIDNTGGSAASLDGSGVTVKAVSQLTNDAGAIGGNGAVAIDAGTVSNNQGKISGVTDVRISADTVINNNGALVAGNALDANVTGALDNANGTIQAVKIGATAGSVNNSAGKLLATGGDPLAVTVTGDVDNTNGFIGGNGDVTLAANNINNTSGTVYAKQALNVTSADRLDNTQGILQADAGLTIRVGGAVGNRQGLLQADRIDMQAGSLDNSTGHVLQLGSGDNVVKIGGALNNAQGVISSNGSNLTIAAGDIDNSTGSISHAGNGKLGITSSGAITNNGGTILTAGELAVDAQNVSNDLQGGKSGQIQADGSAAISASGNISNDGGNIVGSAALALQAQGQLSNRGGAIEAANALTLQGANIDNTGGSAKSLDDSGVKIYVVSGLINDQGSIGGNGAVAIAAKSVSNNQGRISGVTNVDVAVNTLHNDNGRLVAGDALTVQADGALSNAAGTMQAAQTGVTAGSLDNTGGKVVATGSSPLAISISGDAVNNGGFIGGNGDINLAANNVANIGGTIYAAQSLGVNTHKLDNSAGTLQADEKFTANLTEELINKQGMIQADRLAIQAPGLDNTAGKILQLGTDDTSLVFDGALKNAQGTIAVNGRDLKLAGSSIDNSAGAISHAGNGKLEVNSNAAVTNDGGKILTAGALAIDAQHVSNSLQGGKAGLIQAGGSAAVSVSENFSNDGGSIASGAALAVQAQGDLSNRGGSIEAANALVLQGTNIDNTSGRAISLDNSGVTVQAIGNLTNDLGAIGGNGAAVINAGSISNTQGSITGIDNVDVIAANIGNSGGAIESRKRLTIDTGANGYLSNTQHGVLQGEQLSLNAPNFTNAGGSLIQTGTSDTALQFNGTLNNSGGVIATNGNNLTINTQGINNDSGLIKLGGTNTLTLSLPGSISNNGGTISSNGNAIVGATTISNAAQGRIEAAGTLAVTADASLNNNGGTVQSNGALTLTAPAMSNVGGRVYSNSRLTLGVPGFDNTGGTVSADKLSFAPMSSVKNAGGSIIQSGAGDLNFVVSQDVNNVGGIIAANGNLMIGGSSVNNAGGTLRASSGTLTVSTGGALNNEYGVMAAGSALQAGAASIDNQGGTITSNQQLSLASGGGINNNSGTIAASGDATLSGTSLANRGGVAASVSGTLALNTPGGIDNTGGRLESGRDLALNFSNLVNTQGTITGNNISIDTQGNTFDTSSGKIAARGALNIRSGQLNNIGGLLQAAGTLAVDTNGQALVNSQSGASGGIVGLGAVALKTGSLNNQGGYIGAQGALQVTASGSVNNSGGGILGKGQVSIGATSLDNSNGQLQGNGDVTLALSGGTLNNNGGLVRAGGALTVNAGSIANTNTAGSNQGVEGTSVTLNVSSVDNTNGAMHADNLLTINGASLNNTNGAISSAGTLTDNATTINNTGGTLIAAQSLAMNSATVVGSGQYLSNGDLAFNYAGDYNNTSRLVAAGSMTFASGGTITNSGQIGANNTLNLSAANLNNLAGGEISAGTTNITVAGTLNNQGLIDGTNTDIHAGTLNNSNRIYGTRLTVNGGNINNSGAAVMASRGDMTVNAGGLNNSDGATLLSIGNMTLGGGSVVNGSSLIEAHGNLTVTAASLVNRNDTITVTTQNLGSQHVVQYKPVGSTTPLDASAVGFNGYDNGRLVLDSAIYPIAHYGATLYARAVYTSCSDGGCDTTITYSNTSPVWALFGVTPPSAPPADPYAGQFADSCDGDHPGPACSAYLAALSAWKADVLDRSYQLDQKIQVFNGDLSNRMVEDWYVIDATRTTTQTAVQNSNPAHIRVGGDLTLAGGPVINDKSQIIVGGSIGGSAAGNVLNIDAKAEKTIADVGTQQLTEVVACGWDDHCRDWHTPVPYSFSQPIILDGQAVESQPLVYQQHTNPVATKQADALKVISVNQTASGAADAAGNVGNRQSAGGATGVSGVASVGGANVHTDGSNAGGTNVANVQGQTGGNGVAAVSAGAANAVVGNATTGVGGTAQTDAIGSAGAAATNAVAGNTGIGVASAPVQTGNANATGSTVTGNAQTDAVNGAAGAAANTIAPPAANSGPAAVTASAQAVAVGNASANQADSVAKGTVGINGAPAANYTIRTSTPNVVLPTSALYLTRTEPGIGYLVETDPRFTQYQSWLSSDFMLQQLNNDPAKTLKRLGDGFYEQKLVADQIMLATGFRFVGDYSSNEEQYRALMESGVAFGQKYQLTVGMALTAEQMQQLTGDIVWLVKKDVTLADGSVQSVLVPQVYLRVKDGDIQGDGTLVSAREIKLNVAGDLNNNALIASRGLAQITADNINNTDGGRIRAATVDLAARSDLNNLSGTIAGNAVSLSAGRDIAIRTVTIDSTGLNTSRTDLAQAAGVSGQTIAMTAGRDLTIAGAQIDAAGDALLTANRKLAIDTVQAKTGLDIAVSGHIKEETVTNVGSRINAGGNLTIASGLAQDGDLTVRGSTLSAGNALALAGTNVKVEAAVDSRSVDMFTQLKHGSNSINEHTESAVASQLTSGGNLTVAARGSTDIDGNAVAGSGDLTLKGAQLTSTTGAITLAANNDVNLVEQKLVQSRHDESVYRGGTLVSKVSSDGMNNVQRTESVATTVSGESVTIGAGHDILARGATVVGTNDVALLAKNDITITTAQDASSSAHSHQESTSGLFSNGGASITLGKQQQEQMQTGQGVTNTGSQIASLNGNVNMDAGRNYTQTGSQVLALAGDIGIAAQKVDVNAATDSSGSSAQDKSRGSGLTLGVASPIISAAQTVGQMASAAGNTSDPRMKALAAVTSALAVKNAADAMGTASAGNPAGVSLSISLGASKSESSQVQSSTTAVGSTVAAGNDINITAKGAGTDSNLTVTGSRVSAGNNATLKAEGDILLQAAQSTASQHSSNSSAGGSIGLSVGAQTGVTLAANAARGHADGDDVSWINTRVEVGNGVTLASGGDAALKGAVVAGKTVQADIGGNLSIESLQDTSTYTSRQQSFGGSLTIGPSPGASINASKGNVDGTYASVAEQSGIKAGDGGYQITVAGNADLKAGVIASSDKAISEGKNDFNAGGTVTQSDLVNHATYSAASSGIGLGVGSSLGASAGIGNVSGNQSTVTKAGIGVSTSKDTTAAIKPIFDADKVQADVNAQMQITQAFSQQAPKAVASLAGKQAQDLKAQADEAAKAGDEQKAKELRVEAAKWDEGGAYRVALHTAAGALSGGVGGAAGALTTASAAPLLGDLQSATQKALQDAGLDAGTAKAVAQGVAGLTAAGIGAAAGGSQGAGMAMAVDVNNRQLHMTNYDRLKEKCRGSSSTECQTINRMAGVQSGTPIEDPNIPASKVVANYDANGKVVSYVLIDRNTNQPTMIMEPLEYAVYRDAPPGTQALMQLSPQYALDFASAGLYASAGDSSRAMEHTVAGVTSRDYMRDVAMGVVGAAVAAVTVARPPLVVNPAMLDELAANGVKFTPQNVIATGKNANGQVVFLETGNTKSGLAHIIEEHGSQFAQMGISEAEIPSVVMKAVTEGKLIGYQGSGTGRPIYEITINGQPQRIAVTVGSNGYIVGANPKGSGK
jgi:filamentous hemagglutinin family protein